MIEIKPAIHWIGMNDRRTSLFENYWPLPNGVAYNSYLIEDEKVVLVDSVELSFINDFLEEIRAIISTKNIDYLVVNHMEPDHSGSIRTLLNFYPDMVIVGNKKTFPMINAYFGAVANVKEVGDGDTLNVGKHSLQFYTIPMVHWPESMVTYETTTQTLFSNDAFGAFGTLDGGIYADEQDKGLLEQELVRYYSNIVGKFGMPVQKALKKLSGLAIDMICPSHGPIWRDNLDWLLNQYDKWSRYEGDEGVVIAFSSMYGHTEKTADYLARCLVKYGVKKVKIFDTSKTHPSYIIAALFGCKGFICGSCAYNGSVFPTMESLLSEIGNMGVKNRVYASFANKTWGGGALKLLNELPEQLKWDNLNEQFEVEGNMTQADRAECEHLAKAFAEKLKA